MKRTVSFILAVLLVSIALVGCGGNNNADISLQQSSAVENTTVKATDPQPGDLPIAKDKLTLSAFIIGSAADLENNEVTQWLEEKTNIHLDFIEGTAENASDKRNLLINSGDYPDMFLNCWYNGFTGDEVNKYGPQQKVFIPLTDLIEKWGVNTKKVFERYPGIDEDLTQADGNIYGLQFPQRPFHAMEQAGKLFINTTWLKNLGLEMPKTTDEFKTVLQAFKEKDPNGNGKKDEIPMSGCQTWNGYPEMMLLNSFCYYNPNLPLYYNDGKWDMEVYQPAFKDGVKYVADLVASGLIDKASWTQNSDQLKAQVDIDTPSVGSFNMGHLFIPINVGSPRSQEYDIVTPMKGPGGYQGVPWNDDIFVAGAIAAITDKCKYPIEAFRFLDFCASDEASLNLHWGMKGKIWDDVQEGDVNMFGEPAEFHLIKYPTDDDKNIKWGHPGLFQNDMNTRLSANVDINSAEGVEKKIALSSIVYKPYAVEKSPTLIIPADINEKRSLIDTNIKNYINQNLVEFFTGKKNVDTDWDAFIKGLEGLQVKDYIDMTNEAMAAKK